jgi:quercetin dioxygenase-like cupin family protein
MDIKPLGSTASRRGPAESFTGTVWQNPIIEAPAPARIRGAWVRFEPRARTAWHTHPLGQTLHVVSGIGRVQLWGGPIREIRPGDTVWIAPEEKHWHGAGPETEMVHIALQEHLDGKHVTWRHASISANGRSPSSRPRCGRRSRMRSAMCACAAKSRATAARIRPATAISR